MPASRVEQLFEQLVELNSQMLEKLTELVEEVKELKGELDWTNKVSAVAMTIEAVDRVESAVSGLG